jgi:uncharacterized membrane protein YcaP (DUF421 family)
MSAILRPLAIFVIMLIFFRFSGKRSVGEITTFDFLLLLIISESVSSALLADDMSVTAGILAALTLMSADLLLSLLKQRSKFLDRLLEDEPVLLYADGKLQQKRLKKERIDEADILEAARSLHGLERLDQVKYAILERRGYISIIPER